MRFAGRRALVTGALSGMGMAIARLLAREGMTLALAARRAPELAALATETGGRAIVAELGDWAAATTATQRAIEALGGLDAVINCAGITLSGPTRDLDPDDWEAMLGVNLTGPVAICRAAIPALMAGDAPAIVNIASAQALSPPGRTTTAYAATKGGLVSFTRSLAKELGPRIRVNALCPGAVETAITRAVRATDPAAIDTLAQGYALERIGQPEEIAEAALFLATPLSSFITGAAVPIDGGRTFH